VAKVSTLPLQAMLAAWLLGSCGGGSDGASPVPLVQPCGAGVCVSTLAGSGEFGNVDGRGEAARFTMPHAIAVDAEAGLHVADFGNNNLTRLISGDVVSTPAEDTIDFPQPANVASDPAGNKYVADLYGNRIMKVTPAGDTSVLAGTGVGGDQDGDAASASFSLPAGLAFAGGALYVADMGNRKIRKISFPPGAGG
jgi:DNA-binding beta-propeller fold protein YncE